jgi:hypothetical protein
MSEMLGPKLLKINTYIGKSSLILDEDAREEGRHEFVKYSIENIALNKGQRQNRDS